MVYTLVLTSLYAVIHKPDLKERLELLAAGAFWSEEAGRSSLLTAQAEHDELKGALLLPVSHEEERLPGLPEIWRELARDPQRAPAAGSASGFHAMQGVKEGGPFAADWSSNLYLGGVPLEVIRHGNHLFVLTSQKFVQVIACDNPRQPQLKGPLPYGDVRHMAERDGLLYLLLGTPAGGDFTQMVVVSLSNALAPLELARHELPPGTFSFFLDEDHLVVLQKKQRAGEMGRAIELAAQRFSLTKGGAFEPLGVMTTPPLGPKVLLYGDYLILNVSFEGLRIVNYRNFSQSGSVATLAYSDTIKDMLVSGTHLYLLGDQGQVTLIDLTDPQQPKVLVEETEVKQVAYLLFYDEVTYYFARNRHLLVFERTPGDELTRDESVPLAVTGTLETQDAGDGFVLLGKTEGVRPKLVSEVLPLPEATSLRAAVHWRGQWLVLRESGLLESYQYGADGKTQQTASLQLPPGQLWLQGSDQRLYVGGGRELLVIAADVAGRLEVTGRIALTVDASWDAAVSRQTLWLATGSAGLMAFSLTDPDQPVGLQVPDPGLLARLIDVRQLSVAADGRVFVAAGPAGLLCFEVTNDGKVRLCERLDFLQPVVAVSVVGNLCLVATASYVHIVDAELPHSVQKMGEIALPQVKRFVTAPPHFWAGHVKGQGWVFLPTPIRLVPEVKEESGRLSLALPAASPAGRYRVVLYNDAGVVPLDTLYEIKSMPAGVMSGAVRGAL